MNNIHACLGRRGLVLVTVEGVANNSEKAGDSFQVSSDEDKTKMFEIEHNCTMYQFKMFGIFGYYLQPEEDPFLFWPRKTNPTPFQTLFILKKETAVQL